MLELENEKANEEFPAGTPENPLNTIATLPNLITLLRLIFTISFVIMYCTERFRLVGIIFFILAASTDWLDGQVARRTHQVSNFGKRFDPVMDRVLIFSGVLSLLITQRVPVWVALFLIIRDLYLLTGALILRTQKNRMIDVVYVGKTCTFVLMTGFAVLLLDLFPVPGLGIFEASWLPGFGAQGTSFGIWLIYVGVILSFITACVYTVKGIKVLNEKE